VQQASLIDAFQQARPQRRVDRKCRINDFRRYCVRFLSSVFHKIDGVSGSRSQARKGRSTGSAPTHGFEAVKKLNQATDEHGSAQISRLF